MRKLFFGLIVVCLIVGIWIVSRIAIERRIVTELFEKGSPDVAASMIARWEPIALYPSRWKWLKSEAARQQNDAARLKRFCDEALAAGVSEDQAIGPLWLYEASSGAIVNARKHIGRLLILYGQHRSHVFAPIIQGLISKGNLVEANNMMRMWQEHSGERDARLFFWKGVMDATAYNLPQATENFQKAVQFDPQYENARAELADLLLEQVQLEEARTQFEWLLEHYPENSRYITGFARTLLNLGYPDEAAEQLAKLKDLNEASSSEIALVCETNLEAGNAPRALELSKTLVTRWPHAVSYLELASRCEAKLGNETMSQEYATRASDSQMRRPEVDQLITELDNQKQNQELRRKMAELMMTYVDPAGGAGYLEVVVRANPFDYRAHQLLSYYFQQEQNLKRSELHAKMATQIIASLAAAEQQRVLDGSQESPPPPTSPLGLSPPQSSNQP